MKKTMLVIATFSFLFILIMFAIQSLKITSDKIVFWPNFLLDFSVSAVVGSMISYFSFISGEKAERGETENIKRILDEKQKVILSVSAHSTLSKMKDEQRTGFYKFIHALQTLDYNNLLQNNNIKCIHNNDHEYRINHKTRVKFTAFCKKYFIKEIKLYR